MRIDPDSPRARAKMKALDKLTDLLDYSRTGEKQSVSDREAEELEDDISPTGVGETQHDDDHDVDRNPDDLHASNQLHGDDDEGYGSPPDDLDNDNTDYMEESEEPKKYYKTIDMADRDRRDGLKKAAADMPDGPLPERGQHERVKKRR